MTLGLLPLAAGRADETDDLAKEADAALRNASHLMFEGKTAESAAKLEEVDRLLKQIEEKDRRNSRLNGLRSKYQKLQRDLARRTPKGEEKVEQSNTDTPSETRGRTDLPREAREAMRSIRDIERKIEHAFLMIERGKTSELSKSLEDYYTEIEQHIIDLQDQLSRARDLAEEKGIQGHPDIEAVQVYVEEAPSRLNKIREDMRAFTEKRASGRDETNDGATNVTQAQADWKALASLSKTYQEKFQSESDVKELGAQLKRNWTDWKTQFQPVRDRFRARYGTTNPQVWEAFEKIPTPENVAMPAAQAANIAYDIEIPECESRFAAWAIKWGSDALRLSKSIRLENSEKAELKYVRSEDAVRYFNLAKEWGAAADVDRHLAEAEAAVAEALPAWKATLADLKWPGSNKDFAGPGDPEELAAAAIAFLNGHPDWTAPEYDDVHIPLAACVEGKGWEVSKRAPLTDEPTQYSLAILVAFSGQADPDLVYVYHMAFYTTEAAGVRPGLPLRFANSRQHASFRMLRHKIPQSE